MVVVLSYVSNFLTEHDWKSIELTGWPVIIVDTHLHVHDFKMPVEVLGSGILAYGLDLRKQFFQEFGKSSNSVMYSENLLRLSHVRILSIREAFQYLSIMKPGVTANSPFEPVNELLRRKGCYSSAIGGQPISQHMDEIIRWRELGQKSTYVTMIGQISEDFVTVSLKPFVQLEHRVIYWTENLLLHDDLLRSGITLNGGYLFCYAFEREINYEGDKWDPVRSVRGRYSISVGFPRQKWLEPVKLSSDYHISASNTQLDLRGLRGKMGWLRVLTHRFMYGSIGTENLDKLVDYLVLQFSGQNLGFMKDYVDKLRNLLKTKSGWEGMLEARILDNRIFKQIKHKPEGHTLLHFEGLEWYIPTASGQAFITEFLGHRVKIKISGEIWYGAQN